MAQPLIQLNGIAREFSEGREIRRVLKKLDLSIYPGELTILAGPSGCGKKTLLSIMGLLLKPSEGLIFIGDREVSLSSENARAIMRMKYYGFVFQLAELIPALSVIDNVLIGHTIQGKSVSSATREEALTLLSTFGLPDYARGRSKQLSSGQKQRVAPESKDSARVFTVADTRRLRVRVEVDETDIARVTVGQRAWVTADAFADRQFEGAVVRVGVVIGRKNNEGRS